MDISNSNVPDECGHCNIKTFERIWKGYVVKHNYVNEDVLMTILSNYMFRPILAIFRLSSRELKALLYILCAHVMERDLHPGFIA
jgi:hypothetical protein